MENDEASVKDVKTMIQLRRCRKGRFIIRKLLNYLKLDFTKKRIFIEDTLYGLNKLMYFIYAYMIP